MKEESKKIVKSCCKVKLVLLLFLTLTVVDGHWVCDLADVACDDATVAMMCNTQNMNRWAKPSSAEVVTTTGTMPCAIRCAQQGCLCAVYDEGEKYVTEKCFFRSYTIHCLKKLWHFFFNIKIYLIYSFPSVFNVLSKWLRKCELFRIYPSPL